MVKSGKNAESPRQFPGIVGIVLGWETTEQSSKYNYLIYYQYIKP